MVGLGRMGGNMAERLRAHGHEVVGFDVFSEATDVPTLEACIQALATPRLVWVMVPAGDPTEHTIDSLSHAPRAGRRRHRGRQLELARQRAARRRGWRSSASASSTPGPAAACGVAPRATASWWAARPSTSRFAQPVFDALAPEGGFVHTGAAGTGHFTKMVHNGIEYGLMQAYAEGYELLARSGLDIDAKGALSAWRQGSVVRSWLLDLLVRALDQRPGPRGAGARCAGLGRGPVDGAGGHRARRRHARSSAPRCTPGSSARTRTASP